MRTAIVVSLCAGFGCAGAGGPMLPSSPETDYRLFAGKVADDVTLRFCPDGALIIQTQGACAQG